MRQKTLAIMAAGMGSRFGSLKQLHPITTPGYAIIDFSIYDAIKAGFNTIIFIVREEILSTFEQRYKQAFPKDITIHFVLQSTKDVPAKFSSVINRNKPWGTGQALLLLQQLVSDNFALINADDYYGKQAFSLLHDALYKNPTHSNYFVGYQLKNTLSDHGTVSRGICYMDSQNNLSKISERTKIKQNSKGKIVYIDEKNDEILLDKNTTVSMNFWGFTPQIFAYATTLFERFLTENATNEQAEFYIPKIIDFTINNNLLSYQLLSTDAQWYGLTYKEDFDIANKAINTLIQTNEYPKKLR